MILPGFRVAILMGWMTGVVILVKPWGIPKFQWKCLPVLFGLIYLPFFILVNIDLIYCNYLKNSNDTAVTNANGSNKTGHRDRVDRAVTSALFMEVLISNLAMRIIYLWNGRDLADLLARLREYNGSRADKSSPTSFIDIIITFSVYLSTYAAISLEGVETYYYGEGKSIIREYIGPLIHSITLSALFYLPMLIPMKCAFSTIIALSGYLSIIFEDYCQHVLDTIATRKWEGMSIILGTTEVEDVDASETGNRRHAGLFTNELRLLLLERFDIVQKVFDLANKIMSPLALVLLAGSSIAVVMKAYEVVIFRRMHWMFLIKNVFHLVNYVCYYWILQSGQRLMDTISSCKEKLEDKYVQLSADFHQLERQTLRDILSAMKYWDWKFTACDFFVIDRSLASGVVSLIMTYVVVLVQLKVQDEPDAMMNSTIK